MVLGRYLVLGVLGPVGLGAEPGSWRTAAGCSCSFDRSEEERVSRPLAEEVAAHIPEQLCCNRRLWECAASRFHCKITICFSTSDP